MIVVSLVSFNFNGIDVEICCIIDCSKGDVIFYIDADATSAPAIGRDGGVFSNE